mmetsp:Transcript_19849/g.43085  ORF Transcript_19849/g.43085 Transcript_19849/m.43085 type:complete len:158 (-) Transcript_19849:2484-2957(-)
MTIKAKTTNNDNTPPHEPVPIATAVPIYDVVETSAPVEETPDVEMNARPPTNGSGVSSKPAVVPAPVATTNSNARILLHRNLGRNPIGLKCPHCHRETITIAEEQIGMVTISMTILLAIVFWPLCWLPFCLPSCKRTLHYCGHDSCRKKVGLTAPFA